MARHDIECLVECGNYLGETPVWCADAQALWWIDCDPSPSLFRLTHDSGEVRRWSMPARIGAVALASEGRLIVALRDRVGLFDPTTGACETVAASPMSDIGDLHEGRCDRQGRFWIGSISRTGPGRANFHRLDGDRLEPVFGDLTIGNGLAFSPDGCTLYHSDTAQHTVWASEYNPESGDAGPRRPFITVPEQEGLLDGATVDAAGNYWVALFRGSCVRCYSPAGALIEQVDLPITQPTMVTFGGPDLTDLYITSTRWERGESELGLGNLYRIRHCGHGLPDPEFSG